MTITLITGANKGLGRETARRLVAAGHTVYVGARSEDNARRTAEELGARPLLIDITDDASVRAAADRLAAEHDTLDVLVNNAGIAGPRTGVGESTGADVAAVLDTNVVGIVRVTHAFLPLLRSGGHGVVVNVGSGLGSFARVHDPERIESKVPSLAYTASKAAVSMLTVQYARAFPELRVNVVDPGYTATDLNGFSGTQTVEQGAEPIVRAALLTPDGPTGAFFDPEGISPW
ncbi:SDR family NAD(P)-dependent oxidoreductase [Streptomyces sp. SL13]|uniref:SDR family NAD(P)-dependent oxidoreductase n=1 Tax=Streptantibioticus silvisoli TaxID=2705255 RepID=A0AA90HCK1_9ACTN|nr:SDR family NAD(P)-dependent oxidoreductase [Streptantibioticus silvisoli]MDI5962161.1 SDR family NAD(P)-dependent oxidoreductase [Streptantibioticus silvisoli]MDI5972427.1 SDR family NAD(P)-dependent oxidoreductase [Streptantibioticus silvisoli]